MHRLDIPLPPMLLQAIGYPCDARFVALYFGSGDESYYDDGRSSGTGDPHAYLAYIRHAAVALEIAGLDLGSSDYPAEHWLLIDRQASIVYAAGVAEARKFLREQWQECDAGPVLLSPEAVQEVMDHLREAMQARPVPTAAEVMASLREQHRLQGEMIAWLDGTPQAEKAREQIRRMMSGGE